MGNAFIKDLPILLLAPELLYEPLDLPLILGAEPFKLLLLLQCPVSIRLMGGVNLVDR